eukprot:CAMPEP_0204515774 /NCGR_PEP_ID=MMETSP0661-20131031/2795_1 /ASSEMBLY_ACC=CAM_ASM_000606 /TAXON_ID=109239 /ORGANISM="Alexandrium margalefi, Strain AMGDE01CS-322" /LENGTH=163 /DNA_ID=CAMNT_0051521103 /DNA_START=96 /DNA_END=586 /DNA_ORIENTATION=+
MPARARSPKRHFRRFACRQAGMQTNQTKKSAAQSSAVRLAALALDGPDPDARAGAATLTAGSGAASAVASAVAAAAAPVAAAAARGDQHAPHGRRRKPGQPQGAGVAGPLLELHLDCGGLPLRRARLPEGEPAKVLALRDRGPPRQGRLQGRVDVAGRVQPVP